MEGRRRKKKPLSRLAKTFLSYALIAALALPPQAAWAEITEGTTSGKGALAIGEGSIAYDYSTSIGTNAVAGMVSSGYASAFGYNANAKGYCNSAFGYNANATKGSYSSAFGSGANAEGRWSSALGYKANATASNSVALGYNSVASDEYTVSVGAKEGDINGLSEPSIPFTRRIVNVSAGTVADGSTDAVTGGQLYSLGTKAASALSENSTYDAVTNTLTASLTAGDGTTTYSTVQDALDAVYDEAEKKGQWTLATGGASTTVGDGGTVTLAGGDNLEITAENGTYTFSVSENPTFQTIEIGDDTSSYTISKTDGGLDMGGAALSNVASVTTGGVTMSGAGIAMGGLKITGLAAGEVSENSADAVTGGQLYSLRDEYVRYDATTLAIGSGAVTSGLKTTANAINAEAKIFGSSAFGADADAEGMQSSAFGAEAEAEMPNSSAFGYKAHATAQNSVALGANSVASEADTVSVGSSTQQRRIVNVADGTAPGGSTDAVTGGQLYATNQIVKAAETNITNIQSNVAELTSNYSTLNANAVQYDDATKNKITLAGTTNGLTQIANVANGVAETDAVNVGQLNSGVKAGLASLGSQVAGIVGTTIGYDGESFSGVINIGGSDYKTIESALNALYNGTAGSTGGAVGGDEIVIDPSNGAVTIAEGGNIQITQDAADSNKFTIGVSPTPTFTAVYADSANIGGITVGSGGINLGGNKKITGLADGYADTDAVNVKQLRSLGASVKHTLGSEVARVIGGGLSYSGDTFSGGVTVGGTTFTTVQDALNALYNNTGGGSGTQNPDGGEIVIDPSDPAKKVTIAAGDNIQISEDADTEGKYIVGVSESPIFSAVTADNATIGGMVFNGKGIAMDGKTITGLADGLVAMNSTEAVTGGQLYAAKAEIGDDITEINNNITDVTNSITNIDDRVTVTEGDIRTITTNVTNIDKRVSVTEGDIQTITTNVTNIDERVTNNETNVTNIIDGIATGDIDIITGKSLAVKYDDDSKTLVTLNKDGGAVTLANLAEGKLEAGSREAVTGGQLFATNERVTAAEADITGIKADVADVSNNVTELTGNYNALNESAVKYDGGDKTQVTLNDGGAAVKITNVKDGTLAAGSTDAVTGGQLHATNEEIQKLYDAVETGDYNIFTGKSLAVKYDDTDKASITLGDPAAATARAADEGVELRNVADGDDPLDAVNKRQLDAVQGQVDVHETTLEKHETTLAEHETTLNEHTVMIENHEEQFTTLQTILGDTYNNPTFNHITVGNITSDGANIDMGGGTITGLADGNIAQGSTDAVTGNQLWEA